MIAIRDYEEGDVFQLLLREGDAFGTVQDLPFPAWTMTQDDRPIACGGVVQAGQGVGNLWLFVTDEARGHGLKLSRFARKVVIRLFAVMRFHRVQTVIRADKKEYRRWAELMGFQQEAVLRKAGPSQQDLLLYSRVI